MQSTEVINIPSTQFVATERLLEVTGEAVALLPLGRAITEGDLAVWLPRERVLFAGALAQHARVPDLREADTKQLIETIARLQALPAAHIVAGYFPVQGDESGFQDVKHYVQWLREHVQRAVEAGIELSEIQIPLSGTPYEKWERTEHHRASVQRVYLELERELLKK